MQKIIEAVEKYMNIAKKHFHDKTLHAPVIQYSKRGTTAGTATYSSNSVNFNMGIYNENVETFLSTTVPHEVAHLISYQVFGRDGTGHGRNWKFIMEHVFGVAAKRCHSYNVAHHKTRKVRRDWVYQCKCRTHNLSTIKHNKFQEGRSSYRCIHCRSTLIFIGDSEYLNKECA